MAKLFVWLLSDLCYLLSKGLSWFGGKMIRIGNWLCSK
jgi:hypothetical protein